MAVRLTSVSAVPEELAAGCGESGSPAGDVGSSVSRSSAASARPGSTPTGTAGPATLPASSPSASASPSTAGVPVGFAAVDVTWVSASQGWVPGSPPCPSGTCGLVLRSMDRGRSWVVGPASAVAVVGRASGGPDCEEVTCVAMIRFAIPQVGYLFGPCCAAAPVWVTRDGGHTWTAGVPAQGADLLWRVNTIADGREPTGQYRLLTTILDHDEAPAGELGGAYTQRWEIETAFDELKTHQRGPRQVLRSKSPDLVLEEIWGHLFCHYAIRVLMSEAAEHSGHDPDRLSFVAALQISRRWIAQQGTFPLTPPTAPPRDGDG